jgi:hypothetical protein
MSDFDKYFKERLDEEGQFPRREKNWRALSKRLDAFGAGIQEHSTNLRTYLRCWQAAAVSAVAVAGWLTWETVTTQSENAELRREVAALQEKNKAILPQASISEPAGGSPQIFQKENLNTATVHSEIGKNEESPHEVIKPYRNEEILINKVTTGINPTNAVLQADNSSVSNSTVYEKKSPSGGVVGTADSTQAQATNLPQALVEENLSNLKTPPPLLVLPTDSLHEITLISLSKTSPKVLPLPKKDIADAPAEVKIIEPVRSPSRFSAGVQVLAGLPQPHEKGISPIIGQGITAEYNVWKGLWATASADWLRFDVSTKKYCSKFHPPHHPEPPNQIGQPHHPEKLVNVESAQRQQQFGLGLRYAFPVRFWLRPSIRAAYTWTRVSPELIRFKYQKPGGPNWPPSPPKYKVQKSDAQILGDTWRFGAGLEHETPYWVFGLWADYSKSFTANDPSFDMLLFRAGVQYRFN